MSAFEEFGARERDKAWGEMTPVDGGVWARRKLADDYFMACYDRRGLLLTLDSVRAAARAEVIAEIRAWAESNAVRADAMYSRAAVVDLAALRVALLPPTEPKT